MRHNKTKRFHSVRYRPNDLYLLVLPMQIPLMLGRAQSFALAIKLFVLIMANYMLQYLSIKTMTIRPHELLVQKTVFGIPYLVLCRMPLDRAMLEVVQEPFTSKHFMTAKYMQMNENVILRGEAIVRRGHQQYLITQKDWLYYDEILKTLSTIL